MANVGFGITQLDIVGSGTPVIQSSSGSIEFALGSGTPKIESTTGNLELKATEITLTGIVTTSGDITATSGSNHVRIQAGDGSLEIIRSTGDAYIDFKNSTSEDYDTRIAQDGTNAGLVVTGDLNVSGTFSSGSILGNEIVTSRWTLGANGSSDYTFTGPGGLSGTADPKLYLARGQTYEFVNNSGGSHPFQIQTSGGAAYNTGVTNNNASSGTIKFEVPFSAPDTLQYKCTNHSSMGNTIIIYPDLSP